MNKGVEEFDFADKALVWSVVGGKNRVPLGGADAPAEAAIGGICSAIKAAMRKALGFKFKTLEAEQKCRKRRGRQRTCAPGGPARASRSRCAA